MANWEIVDRDTRGVDPTPTLTVTKDREFYVSYGLRQLIGEAFKIVRDGETGAFAICPCQLKDIGKKGYRPVKSHRFSNKRMAEALNLEPGEVLDVRPMDNVLALIRRVAE